MRFPYTSHSLDAFAIAEAATAVALSCMMTRWRGPPPVAKILMGVAVWLAALIPMSTGAVASLPFRPGALDPATVLRVSAAVASVALLLRPPRRVGGIALLGEAILWLLPTGVSDWDNYLSALHLIWFAFLISLRWRLTDPGHAFSTREPAAGALDDLLLFCGVTALAACVGMFVLDHGVDSPDEWANLYQSSAYAHLQAYGPIPPCPKAHRSLWVLYYEGRAFAYNTPGWPLILALFYWLKIPWLAAPLAQGGLSVGVARLTRRVLRAGLTGSPADVATMRSAPLVAGLAAGLGGATLLNAGSYYPHTFVCMLFAWTVESAARLVEDDLSAKEQLIWGAALGLFASWSLSARTVDGLLLGVGPLAYLAIAGIRGRLSWRPFAPAALTFGLTVALTLVLLRLEVGVWFTAGYNIIGKFYPYVVPEFSPPVAGEWRRAVPIEAFAYCFLPCGVPLTVFGLMLTRGEGARVAWMLGLGGFATGIAYANLTFGPHHDFVDFGYGPRYWLWLVVPGGVGAGVLFATLAARTERSSAYLGRAPLVTFLLGPVGGTLGVAVLFYPEAHSLLRQRTALRRALARENVHDAVILVRDGATAYSTLSVTQNDPFGSDDVLVLGDVSETETQCVHELYPKKTFYRARGMDEVALSPE